jgi:ribosomal-protein-alanine N-acetyltransferase
LIRVTAAAAEDVPAIAAMERELFSLGADEQTLRRLAADPDVVFLAAKEGETLAGYASARCVPDEAFLYDLAVREDCRRTGVGRRLLRELASRTRERGCLWLRLEVRAGNTAARALYGSEGFQVDGVRKNYYSAPAEDAVLMTLPL